MKEEKFNKKEYDKVYHEKRRKEKGIKKWGVDLTKEEFEEADNLLKENGLSKTEFLKNALEDLKVNRNKKEGKTMKLNEVKNFLEEKKVEYQEYFSEYFVLGNYSYQDTSLEKNYSIIDGNILTIVDKNHEYAYISIFNKEETEVYDAYVSYETYVQLDTLLEK